MVFSDVHTTLPAGHSGCFISIIQKNGQLAVRKSAPTVEYSHRLKLQYEKQQQFSQILHKIKIPTIWSFNNDSGFFSFDMEYIDYLDTFTFLNYANKKQVNRFINLILYLLHELETLQKWGIFYSAATIEKIISIKNHSNFPPQMNFTVDILIECALSLNNTPYLIGPCHGDLNLTNILIDADANNLCILDFLDSYIDSLLIDVTKLRQDTRYGWGLLKIDNFNINRLNLQNNLTYIDSYIQKYMDNLGCSPMLTYLFEVMNLFRIIPYVRKTEETLQLGNTISRSIEKMQRLL